MTIGTLKTQGTELFFTNPLTTAADIVKVACPTGITGLGGPADQLDDTCLDSTERTFKPGLRTPSAISVPINFIPSSPSHQALLALFQSGQSMNWMIAFSDGTVDPTVVNSAGLITPPANRTSIRFDGYVSDFNLDIATNEIVRATLTIQRSGSILMTPGPTPIA
jgi:hypothetical protein